MKKHRERSRPISRLSEVYANKAWGFSRDDRRRAEIAKVAEPLLEGLSPGEHRFTPPEFRALAAYLLEDEDWLFERALQEDRFRLLSVEIVCERDLTTENGVTLSEFARQHGVSQRTLWNRASKAKLRYIFAGGKKLFDSEDLSLLLEKV